MINDRYLDRIITQNLTQNHLLEKSTHVSSGKLTASMLGQPLQWQILKLLGVPQREFDEYTLRKFIRGQQVEAWLLTHMPNLISKGEQVSYRECVGIIDAVVDSVTGWEVNLGSIPHEIKSVTNAKFRNISLQKTADMQHRMQATLYALAKGATHYAIDYVASDDFRVYTMIYETASTAEKVEQVITEFQATWKLHIIPQFASDLAWQKNPKYNNYPEWVDLTEEQAMEKLKKEYPLQYELFRRKEPSNVN